MAGLGCGRARTSWVCVAGNSGHSCAKHVSRDSAHDADVHPDHPDSRRKPGNGNNDRNAGAEWQANLAKGRISGTCRRPPRTSIDARALEYRQQGRTCKPCARYIPLPFRTFRTATKYSVFCYTPRREFRTVSSATRPAFNAVAYPLPPKLCSLPLSFSRKYR